MAFRLSPGIDYSLDNSLSEEDNAIQNSVFNRYPSLNNKIPNFPSPPPRGVSFFSMPNDLVANGRNYYTEIFFVDYRSAMSMGGGIFGGIVGGINSIIGGAQLAGGIRLPIPFKINDTMVFNWKEFSATQEIANVLGDTGKNALALAQNPLIGLVSGKAVNPLLFLAFQSPSFRVFNFSWLLAPKTRQESATIKTITTLIKNAASPTGGFLMDYPLIALVHMSPRNLNGHAIFHPMAVRSITVDLTPNPNPAFFENTGAPTIVGLNIQMQEIKIWFRGQIP